tara:strand:+ start:332 stop:463 length:132 start_codon:yes stop_codon:yes gene_type:complete
MKKTTKRKVQNPVAKNAAKFNKAKVFADKTKYNRKKNKFSKDQ